MWGRLLARLSLQVSPCILGISSLSQASGAYSSLSVTPEMLALSFVLSSPQTRFVAFPSRHDCPFPILLCLQLLCLPQTCFAATRNFTTFAVYTKYLPSSAQVHLISSPSPLKKNIFLFYSCSSLMSPLTVAFWLVFVLRSFIIIRCSLYSGT